MLKIDLHTHSQASSDGSISLAAYEASDLDTIAITDHNTIAFAGMAQKKLGKDKVIIGEEIMTTEGEIIGLYLSKLVPARLSLLETVKKIKEQDGLVYIPHPFETVRSGVTLQGLNSIIDDVDIIEIPNGRSLQPKDSLALSWAQKHNVAIAASSDAHREKALGKTHTVLGNPFTKQTLVDELKKASTLYKRPSLGDLAAPKYNRFMKKIRKNQ